MPWCETSKIIGEAVKNLPVEFRARHPSVDWKRLAGLRDILIHRYFGIDLDIVWDIIRNKLPVLHKQVKAMLSKEE